MYNFLRVEFLSNLHQILKVLIIWGCFLVCYVYFKYCRLDSKAYLRYLFSVESGLVVKP